MLKIGALVAAFGLALLAASALPWDRTPADGGTVAAADAGYGRTLFEAKSCAQCHRHAAVPNSGRFGGGYPAPAPDLTNRPLDQTYLRAWLRDPRAVKPTTEMPNLDLSGAEIDALVVFLQPAAPSTR